jgi:hypothetical protein
MITSNMYFPSLALDPSLTRSVENVKLSFPAHSSGKACENGKGMGRGKEVNPHQPPRVKQKWQHVLGRGGYGRTNRELMLGK